MAKEVSADAGLLLSALIYARRGWRVFPLRPRTKEPYEGIGVYQATTDEAAIRAWWRRNPNSNIAVATGRESGIFLFDLDYHKEGCQEAFAELQIKHGPFPETAEARSGSGGGHFIFQHPRDFIVHNSAGKLGPGIDIRGAGGYVVVAPSVHPSGGTYEWKRDQDAAPAPEWLLDWLRAQPARDSLKPEDIAKIPVGQRDEKLFRLACSFRRKGLTAAEIAPALLEINRGRCEVPLADAEVIAKAESACRYEPADPFLESPEEAGEAQIDGVPEDWKRPDEILLSLPPAGSGIPTRIPTIDRIFRGGMLPGVISVQGPPGVGKTSLIQQFGLEAIDQGRACCIALLDDEGRTPGAIRFGQAVGVDRWKLESSDPEAISVFTSLMSRLPLLLPDTDLKQNTIKAVLEVASKLWPLLPPVVLIDSIQSIAPKLTRKNQGGEKRHMIEELLKDARTLFPMFGATFIFASHVNRGSYASKDPAARTSKLAGGAESADIERYCDVIFDLEGDPQEYVSVATPKNRRGTNEKPTFRMKFDRESARFSEISEAETAQQEEAIQERSLTDLCGKIIEFLEKHPESSRRTIEKHTEARSVKIGAALRRLEETGKATFRNGKGGAELWKTI